MKTSFLRAWTLAVALALPLAAPVANSAVPEGVRDPAKHASKLYIVQMADAPVVAYEGGVPGYPATAQPRGSKINPLDPNVVKYVGYLTAKHDAALQKVGGAPKAYSYTYAFNGFAAELSPAQIAALRSDPNVLNVSKDEIRPLDTSSTPTFLGLNAPGGIWSMLSGNANGNPIAANGPNSGGAGEGVVVGIVDSGIWPENPSFADRDATTGQLVFQQLPGWHGRCVPGELFTAANCNQKLIGAQWYGAGFGGREGVRTAFPYEFWSPRGADGHGSHTASTAAGNFGVDAVVNGSSLGRISGMAPRARVAVYKVCWGIGDAGGCASSDSVAAIDQAVADGVDVLNFSISGSTTNFLDPVEVAFLFAARAGVFVAASAGNSGPTSSTVAHNSPWLTTVAAGTHDRLYVAVATLGNGVSYTGAGLGAAVPSSPLVVAANVALPGVGASAATLCFAAIDNGGKPALDPAKVAGKIVVCDRGTNARVNKSLAVKEAGGVGMILVNTSPNSLNADLHWVPTVHLPDTDRAAILTYAATTNPTASLAAGQQVLGARAPDVASFSSRGPARAGAGDLLKPDIMAPGVDVLAAVSPVENGRNFDFLSGTSMSGPHIAGIGALFKQKYPTWSPAAIKSALMTTASQRRNDGSAIPGSPFGFGAGQVTPNSATDPGLVFDAGYTDWLGFLCGSGQLVASFCGSIAIDPSDLNYPSIAIGAVAGIQTITRTVTNVGPAAATYTATVAGPSGFAVQVTPASFTIPKNGKQTFTVKFTRTTATFNAFSFGSLTWSDGTHTVRSPLVVRPVALAAPAQVSRSYTVAFGYDGAFTATPRGLVPAALTPGNVAQDPDQTFDPAKTEGTVAIQVTIPAGTTYARFSLFEADVTPGSDLDMYVYRGTTRVGVSAGGTANEEVNLVNPAADTYTVYVHGWGVPAGTTPFKLHTWLLGTADAGNMTVTAPSTAVLGGTGTIALSFSNLTAGVKYLGSVVYGPAANLADPTIVRVDP